MIVGSLDIGGDEAKKSREGVLSNCVYLCNRSVLFLWQGRVCKRSRMCKKFTDLINLRIKVECRKETIESDMGE